VGESALRKGHKREIPVQVGSSTVADPGSRHAGREDLSPLLQNPIRPSSIDTISIETTYEANPPLLSAAQSGSGKLSLDVSKALVFETVTQGTREHHESDP
jgi:hypothetical protein